MSLAAVRTALVELVAGLPNMGPVHGYQRYARDEAAFREFYLYAAPGGAQQLRGWQISNTAIAERTLGVGRTLNQHTWQIRGYLALADAEATELLFDDLVERIRTAFRADPTLGGLCSAEALGEADGVQKLDAGPVLFCGVLCHSALLQLDTWSYL